MSDPVVIAAFVSQLETLTTPYVDTLNVRPGNLPSTFVSLERDYSSVDRVNLGPSPNAQWRELGTLTVVVNVPAGSGYTAAQVICEEVRDLFFDFADEHLQIMNVSSGAVFDPDDGSFFQMKVPVQYQFDFFK